MEIYHGSLSTIADVRILCQTYKKSVLPSTAAQVQEGTVIISDDINYTDGLRWKLMSRGNRPDGKDFEDTKTCIHFQFVKCPHWELLKHVLIMPRPLSLRSVDYLYLTYYEGPQSFRLLRPSEDTNLERFSEGSFESQIIISTNVWLPPLEPSGDLGIHEVDMRMKGLLDQYVSAVFGSS